MQNLTWSLTEVPYFSGTLFSRNYIKQTSYWYWQFFKTNRKLHFLSSACYFIVFNYCSFCHYYFDIQFFLFSRTLFCKPKPSDLCKEEAKQNIRIKKSSFQRNTENESVNCLLHSFCTSDVTSNSLISKRNWQYDSRNPSKNAEYTETKYVYTEMTALSLTSRGKSLQLLRQPCQSVEDTVYSATDTLRFESETDTKEFLNK